MHCTILYCTVLYCTILCCTRLYCTILHCTILYCTILYCTILYCTILYCTVLYCTVLYCTILYCNEHCSLPSTVYNVQVKSKQNSLHSSLVWTHTWFHGHEATPVTPCSAALNCTAALHCTALHPCSAALNCTAALYCTTMHCTAIVLHWNTLQTFLKPAASCLIVPPQPKHYKRPVKEYKPNEPDDIFSWLFWIF